MSRLVRPKRGLVLALVALIALALSATALAAKTVKSHKVNATITATGLTSANGVTTIVGTVKGKPFRGEGAVVYRVKAASGGQLAATVTAFDKRGSVSGTALATSTAGPNGSSTLTGTAKVTSGAGAYAGAKGKNLKISGGAASADAPIVFKVTGTIKY